MPSDVLGIIAPHPPIMVPQVGGDRSRVTSDSAEAMAEAASLLATFGPDTVVLMSPHAPAARNAFAIDTSPHLTGSLAQFGAADASHSTSTDTELAMRLLSELEASGIPALDRQGVRDLDPGHLDHGCLVPLHFLDPEARWPLVVLSLSWLPFESHRSLGRAVATAAADLGRRIAFVASGDCSHRLTRDAPAGYSPRGAAFDSELVRLIGAGDFEGLSSIDPHLIEEAGECGLRSFITLGGAVGHAPARVLAYEGPWGVGYLTAVANEEAAIASAGSKGGLPGESEHEIVCLARQTIEACVGDRDVPAPVSLADPALPPRAGAFVSLHRDDCLRGCIGTIAPVMSSLAEEVVRNAVEASTRDPRFPPVAPEELADLHISVDVLHPAEPARIEDLDPSRFGLIVTSGHRRGLLLPDLEGVDTPAQQLDICRRKGGIPAGERVTLERFRVDRYT